MITVNYRDNFKKVPSFVLSFPSPTSCPLGVFPLSFGFGGCFIFIFLFFKARLIYQSDTMRVQRAVAALHNGQRLLGPRCSARFLTIRPTATASSTLSSPAPMIAAPIQVGGRRYFNLTKPRFAVVSGAAGAA